MRKLIINVLLVYACGCTHMYVWEVKDFLWSPFFPSTSIWALHRPQTLSLVGQALYL